MPVLTSTRSGRSIRSAITPDWMELHVALPAGEIPSSIYAGSIRHPAVPLHRNFKSDSLALRADPNGWKTPSRSPTPTINSPPTGVGLADMLTPALPRPPVTPVHLDDS